MGGTAEHEAAPDDGPSTYSLAPELDVSRRRLIFSLLLLAVLSSLATIWLTIWGWWAPDEDIRGLTQVPQEKIFSWISKLFRPDFFRNSLFPRSGPRSGG
jgi:hypothetical protein